MEKRKLAILRAAIAALNVPKKELARKCGVSAPYFSEYIHGDREIPESVFAQLLSELGLQKNFNQDERGDANNECEQTDHCEHQNENQKFEKKESKKNANCECDCH